MSVSEERNITHSKRSAIRTMSDWAEMFHKLFNESSIMTLLPKNSSTALSGYYEVRDAETAATHCYIWPVVMNYMSSSNPIYFKLEHTSAETADDATNASKTLYVAYEDHTGRGKAWIPLMVMPTVTTESGWADAIRASNDVTVYIYHAFHVIETSQQDIMIQGIIQWRGTNNLVNNTASGANGTISVPLFAILQAADRTNGSNITPIVTGFSPMIATSSATEGNHFSPVIIFDKQTTSNSSTSGGDSAGQYMWPSIFVAPDISTETTYGIVLPWDMCDIARQGFSTMAISSSTTYGSRISRIPIYPGPVRANFKDGANAPSIVTQLMVPIMCPYSKYIAKNAGALLFSDGWKRGKATFNGHSYIFIDNFALLND